MADTFELEIVSPERLLVHEAAEEVQLPASNGYIGVLPGHAPLITEMGAGEISYRAAGSTYYVAVSWGFAEALPDRVTVLAAAAERAEDIDVKRAEEARARAEERLRSTDNTIDTDRALKALRRAEVRLQVAQRATVVR
jgi:F-type H+-transporting ATPase subunit epsilon